MRTKKTTKEIKEAVVKVQTPVEEIIDKNTVVFTDDFEKMLEVERVLVKKMKLKWSHLSYNVLFLKEKIGNDDNLKSIGGICFLLKDHNITWSNGSISKRNADKSKSIEVIDVSQFLKDPYQYV